MDFGQDEVDESAVKSAIAEIPREFCTKDISSHPNVVSAHGSSVGDPRYHQVIGSYLGANRGWLGLTSIGRCGSGKGEKWRKNVESTSAQVPEDVTRRLNELMARFKTED